MYKRLCARAGTDLPARREIKKNRLNAAAKMQTRPPESKRFFAMLEAEDRFSDGRFNHNTA